MIRNPYFHHTLLNLSTCQSKYGSKCEPAPLAPQHLGNPPSLVTRLIHFSFTSFEDFQNVGLFAPMKIRTEQGDLQNLFSWKRGGCFFACYTSGSRPRIMFCAIFWYFVSILLRSLVRFQLCKGVYAKKILFLFIKLILYIDIEYFS